MSGFDGSWIEMPGPGPIDDDAIEAALASVAGEEVSELALLVSNVRNVVMTPPAPSAAMAAVLAAGFSTDKGDLPATAASNVHGPAMQVSGLSKWRKAKMKIQGFLAGIGIAGKIALGVGVAAAATTGAGATGMLPFSLTGGGHTTHHETVSTTVPPTTLVNGTGGTTGNDPKPGSEAPPTTAPKHQGTTPTTSAPPTPTTVVTTPPAPPGTDPAPPPTTPRPTPTTVVEHTTVPPATTTTAPPTTVPPRTGQTITLSCTVTGATQVTCNWNAAANPVASYQLWRWSGAADYAPITGNLTDTFTFVDNTPTPATTYTYRVFTKRSDGSSGDVSNRVQIACCS